MAWLLALAPRVDTSDEQPKVALISLFDGTGLARVAVELAMGDQRDRLVQAGFAELDNGLSMAVQQYWDRRAGLTSCAPYKRLAGYVWDLVRGNPTPH